MERELIISSIRKLLGKILPKNASAFLFGSQARGDNRQDSDWDILIILDKNGPLEIAEIGKITFPIYEFAANIGIEINPVVYTGSEWSRRSFTPFYKNVTTDQIRLWG